jgi:acetyltransferase-like isoleucine patch superfamily enzyme
MKTLFQELSRDIRFHEQLKRGGECGSFFDRAAIFFRSRGLWFALFYRIIYYSSNHKNLRSAKWWIARILEIPAVYLSTVACKCGVLGDCVIDEGVYLPDAGYLTCGALAIGSGSIVHDHVTFGLSVANKESGRPRIGKNVWIGPNCIIAGGLEVGDGATILPGTYLNYSIPAGTVVRGNPARVVHENFDNSAIRRSLAIVEDIGQA